MIELARKAMFNKAARVAVLMLTAAAFLPTNAQALTGGPGWAWGWNAFGQLSNGTYTDSSTPVAVSMPSGVIFTLIAAGQAHSLALSAPGRPANLTLAPKTQTATVKSQACLTATVTDKSGAPVPNVNVVFSVPTAAATQASPASGTGTNRECRPVSTFKRSRTSGTRAGQPPGSVQPLPWRSRMT